jgi:hypothetical protein
MIDRLDTHSWISPVAGQGREHTCRRCGLRRSQQDENVPCQPDIPQDQVQDNDYDPFE